MYLCCRADFSICLTVQSKKCSKEGVQKAASNTGWETCIHAVRGKKTWLTFTLSTCITRSALTESITASILNWFLSSGLSHRDSFHFMAAWVQTKQFYGIRKNIAVVFLMIEEDRAHLDRDACCPYTKIRGSTEGIQPIMKAKRTHFHTFRSSKR